MIYFVWFHVQECNLDGCSLPVFFDSAKNHVHDFCSKKHADEAIVDGQWIRSTTLASNNADASKCQLPGCQKGVYMDPLTRLVSGIFCPISPGNIMMSSGVQTTRTACQVACAISVNGSVNAECSSVGTGQRPSLLTPQPFRRLPEWKRHSTPPIKRISPMYRVHFNVKCGMSGARRWQPAASSTETPKSLVLYKQDRIVSELGKCSKNSMVGTGAYSVKPSLCVTRYSFKVQNDFTWASQVLSPTEVRSNLPASPAR